VVHAILIKWGINYDKQWLKQILLRVTLDKSSLFNLRCTQIYLDLAIFHPTELVGNIKCYCLKCRDCPRFCMIVAAKEEKESKCCFVLMAHQSC